MLQKARRDATNGILPPRREKKEETTAVPSRSSASPDMLFSDYILMWLHAMRYTWADTTFVAYQRAVTREIAPYFADKQIRLNELTTMDIQEYYASLQRRGMGGNTIIHFTPTSERVWLMLFMYSSSCLPIQLQKSFVLKWTILRHLTMMQSS